MSALDILSRFGPALRRAEPLACHTTFAIGGPADGFLPVPSVPVLEEALAEARRVGLPVFVLGGGSNLLVSDAGVEGLVLHLRLQGREAEGLELVVWAGEPLWGTVLYAADLGLAGLETLAGIPGTVGGAVCGNAGAYGTQIADRLVAVRVLRGGKDRWIRREELDFGYRSSEFKAEGGVVLQARLRLEKDDPEAIRARAREVVAKRDAKLPPPDLPSAGSFFKNLPALEPGGWRRAAGKYLDEAGMRGARVGGAQVWPGHANIIVNTGGARAKDVIALAARMAAAVESRFGIHLEEEVRRVGRF